MTSREAFGAVLFLTIGWAVFYYFGPLAAFCFFVMVRALL